MADKTLAVRIDAQDNASATFKKVGDSAQTMGESIEGAAKKSTGGLKDLSAELNTAGQSLTVLGAVGVGLFSYAAQSSMEFTAAMSNVNSIARLSASELDGLRSSIIGLAESYAASPTDLADGLYNIIGSGFEAADAIDILTASVIAAGAGLTSTEVAATAVTAVLNAYGMAADQAGNVSDILFKIVDSGVISFDTLADSMGRTLPLASSLGVSLEELGAGYAALTRMGFSGDMAETGLAALMTAAIGPTEALKEAVKAYGYETTEALIAAEGFAGFLEFLQTTAGGSSEMMLALTGNTRANGAALALSAQDGRVYVQMLDDMNSAAQDGAYTLEVFGIQMDNAAGSVAEFSSVFETFLIKAGEGLEPLVKFGAETATMVLGAFNALPGPLSDAITLFGAGASVITAFAGGFLLLVPRIVETRAALQTLAGANGLLGMMARGIPALFGPAGIAIAGVTVAATVGISAWNRHKASVQSAKEAYDELVGAIATVDQTIGNLKLTGDIVTAFKLEALVNGTRTAGDVWKVTLDGMQSDWNDLVETMGTESVDLDFLSNPAVSNMLQGMVDAGTIRKDVMESILAGDVDTILLYAPQIRAAMDQYYAAYLPTDSDKALIEANMGELMDFIGNPDIDADKVMADWVAARKKYLEGDHPDYMGFDAWWEQYKADAIEGIAVTRLFGDVVQSVGSRAFDLAEKDLILAKKRKEAYEEYMETVREGLTSLLEFAGLDDPLSKWNLSGRATDASTLADRIGDLGVAMDNNYRIIVSNTDAMASNLQALDDWATGLIGIRGEWSELDKLYNEGRISLEKYNEAQIAQETIMNANATVQRDVLAIQAALSPVVAQNAEEYAKYIQQLRELNDGIDDSADGAQQQMAALAWMDQSTAGRVQQFIELGQQMDALDESGRAAFETMVDGLAATDPLMLSVLANAGLVKQELDGSWSVNWEGLGGADSDIQRLIESIDALTLALGGVPPTVTTTVDLVDNASSTLDYITGQLGLLDGKTATTYIRTMYETYGTIPGYVGPTMFTGGYVGEYATGGVTFRAGEIGTEMAHFPTGGVALIPRDGIYQAPAGTYISPNNAVGNSYGGNTFNVYLQGDYYGDQDFQEKVAAAIAPVIEQAGSNLRRSAGVA